MTDTKSEPTDLASRLVLGIGGIALWLFLIAILLSFWEVGARYLFNAPSNWIHVTTTTLCAVGFAFGGAWCMVRREHIRVDFLPEKVGPKGKRAIEILSLIVGLFYLGGLGYGLWIDASGAIWRFDWRGNWTPEATPGPPNWPLPSIVKASLLIGAVLFALVCLVQLARLVLPRRSGT